jgi:hypothetical protein
VPWIPKDFPPLLGNEDSSGYLTTFDCLIACALPSGAIEFHQPMLSLSTLDTRGYVAISVSVSVLVSGLSTRHGPWEHMPLMSGILLMQSTQLPRKLMDWMRLTYVHFAPRSTPPHLVVKCNDTFCAGCIAPYTCWDKTVYLAQYMSHVLSKWNAQPWSDFVCSVGKGLGLILVFLGIFSRVG